MATCKKCGAENQGGNFCKKCGANLQEQQSITPQPKRTKKKKKSYGALGLAVALIVSAAVLTGSGFVLIKAGIFPTGVKSVEKELKTSEKETEPETEEVDKETTAETLESNLGQKTVQGPESESTLSREVSLADNSSPSMSDQLNDYFYAVSPNIQVKWDDYMTVTGNQAVVYGFAACENDSRFVGYTDMKRFQANFIKDNSRPETYILQNAAPVKTFTQHSFQTAEASSVCAPQAGNTYGPDQALDQNEQTAWIEGVNGFGVGEWIKISAPEEKLVYGLCLKNGYKKTEKTLRVNAQVRSILVEFSDGSQNTYSLNDNDPSYTGYSDMIKFDHPVMTSSIKITIQDVYESSDYIDPFTGKVSKKCEDTCLSEIFPLEG